MSFKLSIPTERIISRFLPYPLDGLKKPIPYRADDAPTALGYHGEPVDVTLPLSSEPLVMASNYGLSNQSYYAREDGGNEPYNRAIPAALKEVWMRESVAVRLVHINKLLAQRGLELHLFDAYRPIETQQALWDHFIEEGREKLQSNDAETLRQYAGHYVSEPTGFDPGDSLTWPTHNTGGAVDVTLKIKNTERLLEMGGGFDESSDRTFTDHYERNQTSETNEAMINRRVLFNAMIKMGFTNYPYEWWHFDYGTQMWLLNGGRLTGCNKAWYGPARLPV